MHELAVDDFELLRRWTGGDAVAGDLLARRYYPNVRRFFDVKVPAHAEDLTQRTFLACAENLAGFRGDATFKAYLFGIARIQLLRHLRHSKVREAHAAKKSWSTWSGGSGGSGRSGGSGGSSGSGWSSTSARRTSLSMIVANRQEHHFLLLAYAKLPPDQQIAIELYYWEDMTSSEIGAALDVPTSTVTTRLSRARAALGKAVEDLTSPGAVRESLVADLDGWTRSLCSR